MEKAMPSFAPCSAPKLNCSSFGTSSNSCPNLWTVCTSHYAQKKSPWYPFAAIISGFGG